MSAPKLLLSALTLSMASLTLSACGSDGDKVKEESDRIEDQVKDEYDSIEDKVADITVAILGSFPFWPY